MSNILAEIVAQKHKEVAERQTNRLVQDLERATLFNRKTLSLKSFLVAPTRTGIIAEFKRKSPSKGIINDMVKVQTVTGAYNRFGASGLSVLTDGPYFGGSIDDLIQAREINNIPILRKDFIVDEYQIIEAKAIGADVILLIAECLTKEQVAQFAKTAHDLDLEVLLEIHSAEQLDKVAKDVDLVGVNNRDLTTFTVDVNRSFELAPLIPADKVKVAESGITDVNVIISLKKAGFDGFLIGEHFMKQSSPDKAFERFAGDLQHQLASL
ncbi:indole-3-glycerol phosphate synthase [Chitinophaga caeni]|uniref:Indole-3-glycerol phosphate synthase n=1 Tax=Chitinophaga caeni TaxID=2029983 RepID=A0A291QU54_9BACT|nr:indole-3-glycerol phosphate synthase TrpC [Chitinophaga caeni]ATL47559.1 indole-3-glycerol phosphate synthase [Chitinophaga caeni]